MSTIEGGSLAFGDQLIVLDEKYLAQVNAVVKCGVPERSSNKQRCFEAPIPVELLQVVIPLLMKKDSPDLSDSYVRNTAAHFFNTLRRRNWLEGDADENSTLSEAKANSVLTSQSIEALASSLDQPTFQLLKNAVYVLAQIHLYGT